MEAGVCMRLIDRYFLKQTVQPFVFFTLILTCVIWLAQSLRVIDLIVNNGQSARILIDFAVPLLPQVMSIVLPIAALAAVIFSLNRALIDSEMVVVYATGQGRLSAIRAIIWFGALVSVILAIVVIVLMPLGQQTLRDRTAAIRADVAAGLIQDGRFIHPGESLTVYIREENGPEDMRGLLVHDARDPDEQVTLHARRGVLTDSPQGPRLVMFDGMAQRMNTETKALNLLQFEKLTYDLSAFGLDPDDRKRKPSEYFFWELLWPEGDLDERDRARFTSEGHEHLTTPLYGIAIALVAAAAMLGGHFSRRGYLWRVMLAAALGVTVRISGIVIQNMVKSNAEIWPLMYLPPVLGTIVALWFLSRGRFPDPAPPPTIQAAP
jgi:lipopolysaccharide export system permease protein